MTPAHLVDAAGGGLVQAVGPPDLVTQPQCVEAPHLRGVVRIVCNVCCVITVLLELCVNVCCSSAPHREVLAVRAERHGGDGVVVLGRAVQLPPEGVPHPVPIKQIFSVPASDIFSSCPHLHSSPPVTILPVLADQSQQSTWTNQSSVSGHGATC